MTVPLKLTHDEPRLVYLALVYHLGRPGSELDATTKMPLEHGLRDVKIALGSELAGDSAIIEVDEAQSQKLLSAMYGCVTELRGHHMRGGTPSTVDRFTETALELFPQIAAEPEEALTIAQALVMLHRRMERALNGVFDASSASTAAHAAAPEPVSKRGWPFRRRSLR